MREKYAFFMAHPQELEDILQVGAKKARRLATPFLATLREAVGLRQFHAVGATRKGKVLPKKKATAAIKQYRGEDGKFYFKLTDSTGCVLLTSRPFESGKEAGMAVGQIKQGKLQDVLAHVVLADGVTEEAVRQALAELA